MPSRPWSRRRGTEFADTEAMIAAVEQLYGPYRWGRYDLLVLPPSFPFGGMENPRLTFATPTVLAGDKSPGLAGRARAGALVVGQPGHQRHLERFLAQRGLHHYVERRIIEEVYGPSAPRWKRCSAARSCETEMAKLPEKDQICTSTLRAATRMTGCQQLPYEKGALFLRTLEQAFGRAAVRRFPAGLLRTILRSRASPPTQFLDYLHENLLSSDRNAAALIPLDEWIYKPGIPNSAPRVTSDAFARVEASVPSGCTARSGLDESKTWSSQEWIHFRGRCQPIWTPGGWRNWTEPSISREPAMTRSWWSGWSAPFAGIMPRRCRGWSSF